MRRFIQLLIIPVLFLSSVLTHAQDKPNIVVIMVDDMGWTGLSSYGSDLHQTPHIDQLASDGMKFNQAYASAPVCTPTRAAFMTGKSPAQLNMTIWHEASRVPQKNRPLNPPVVEGNLPHKEVTIAEVLREGGYRTGHVGKWHLGEASHYPETHGFDFTFGGSFWGAPPTFYFPYRGTWGSGERAHPRYIPGIDATEDREGEHLTDRLTDKAVQFITQSAGEPFFLYMSYYTVHTPIEGKPEVAERYKDAIHPGMDHDNAHYAAMHETLDDNVGRIRQTIEDSGVADNTIVILTSDNGGFINNYDGQTVTSNAPLRSGKGSLYEGGVRVPLIIHWPGVTKPQSISEQAVITADLYPTILEMTGLTGDSDHNRDVEGISLTPTLQNPDSSLRRTTLYWHYPHYYQTTSPVSSIRQRQWKLMEFHEDGRLELYDLISDPGETNNQADTRPPLAANLQAKLQAWRDKVKAPMPKPNLDNKN